MANSSKKHESVSIRTGVGTFSFPHVFRQTAMDKVDNEGKASKSYEIQFLIPKSDKAAVREIMLAIKKTAESRWGANWKQVRNPLRDGDKEKNELTESGATKEEKYPERLGHYFLTARSGRPVAVVDRNLTPIVDEEEVYSGAKGRLNVTFFSYSNTSHGVGVGLNGVQKTGDGDPLGGSNTPAVSTMFDALDDDEAEDIDDIDLDEIEDEIEEAPKPKAKAKPKAKVEVDEEDELDEDEFDDLD